MFQNIIAKIEIIQNRITKKDQLLKHNHHEETICQKQKNQQENLPEDRTFKRPSTKTEF